jgi:uncharacterized lipoprotein YddW (UPF0748 family)
MKYFFITSFLCCILNIIIAQPKRELRGAWVATVSNIDWPSSASLTSAQQQAEITSILNDQKSTGINAIYLQVRGECDAIYPSTIEPWSRIFGTNTPNYDPLQFWIDECRKRGMEFHAWFNPYRAATSSNNTYASNHITNTRPDLILAQGTLRVLDPGKPDSWNFAIKVFMDVLRRYDVDGIHFDDYFYPYPPSSGSAYNDDATFAAMPRGFTDKLAWRRNNIDTLIRQVYDSVKLVKPWVKFGVSPFGIWRNQASSTQGSATSGLQSYDAIHADTRSWLQKQWVDYMMPQVYWSIGFSPANYAVLVPWWSSNANGRHIYIGQAAYKVNNGGTDANWISGSQIPSQIRLHRPIANVFGSNFFSTKNVNQNPLGMRDSLRNDFFKIPCLLPTMPWRDNVVPAAASNLSFTLNGNNVELQWQKPTATSDELQKVRQFVVYRSTTTPVDITTANNIRTVTNKDTVKYIDASVADGTYYYTVTSLDRLHNESAVSNTITVALNTTDINEVNSLVSDFKISNENPTTGIIKLKFTVLQFLKNVTIRVVDNSGKVMSTISMSNRVIGTHNLSINTHNFASGVYYLNLITGKGTKTVKVIVK